MDEGWLPHRSPAYGYKCLSKREVLSGLSRPRWILENGKRVAAPANERHPQLLLAGDAKMEAAVKLAYELADKGRTIYSIVTEFNDAEFSPPGSLGNTNQVHGVSRRLSNCSPIPLIAVSISVRVACSFAIS